MQNKPGVIDFRRLSQSRWTWIIGSLVIVLILVIGLVVVVGRAYGPMFREFFISNGSISSPISATPTVEPDSMQVTPTRTKPVETPTATPGPTPKPPLTLVWSKEYSQVYLRQEPGGSIIRQLNNGSSVLVSEKQTVQGMEWAHVLYFDGDEDIDGWIAALLVFTIRSDLPLMQVTGENGANLRAEPGGALLAWLPYGTPVQIIETAEIDEMAWVHVVLPDERRGWVAQRLLNTLAP
jgi:hypothetical protein